VPQSAMPLRLMPSRESRGSGGGSGGVSAGALEGTASRRARAAA
jgi:hypothetical protein